MIPFHLEKTKNSPTAQSPGSLKTGVVDPTRPMQIWKTAEKLGAVLARIFDTWQDTFELLKFEMFLTTIIQEMNL